MTYKPSTATSRWFPVKSRHIRVTSGHVRPRNVISCHVTATSCELQASKTSNVPKTWLTGLLQPLPGDFRSNVTSRHVKSSDVISSYLTATSCELQNCRSSNVPKTWRTGLVQPLPGDFRSKDITSGSLPVPWGPWRHFLSRDCHLLRVTGLTSSTVLETWLRGLLQPLPGNFQSNDVKSGSLPVTWRHFLSRHCNLPRVTAL